MRGAATQLRDHAGDVRERRPQRRPGHRGDEHVAGGDALELALAAHYPGTALAPADSRGVTVEARALELDLVGHPGFRNAQRPRLEKLDPGIVRRPFDLDRSP